MSVRQAHARRVRGSARLARTAALLAALALLSTQAPSGTSAAAHASEPFAQRLTLRLVDLPRGYRIDEQGCGGGTEGAPPRLAAIVIRYRPDVCSVQFQNAWYGAEASKRGQPPVVESVAVSFTSAAGARAAFAIAPELAAYALASPGRLRGLASAPADLGEERRAYATDTANVLGKLGYRGFALVWRSGRIVSLTFVAGLPRQRGLASLGALARRQQQRLAQPTQLAPADNDDTEVALDHPRLDLPVVWLGRSFSARGLPALRLFLAQGPYGPGESPGYRVSLDYVGLKRRSGGAQLGLWRPSVWQAHRQTPLGRLIWDSPCAQRTRLSLPAGFALIYGGYAETQGPCPSGLFDRYVAHVYLRGVVVTINQPICFRCAEPGQADDPYNSLAGMRALARGLVLRRR